VGVKGLIDQAVTLAAPRGRIVVAGVMMGEDEFMPLKAIGKELTLKFTQCYSPKDYEVVLDLLDQKRIDPSPMVTEIVDFNSLPERFEALRRPTTQCKILISPSA
jgi:(R,R)-butanediol dehydrogenase/meso-butanediol dehydrogenase/diacetyl reductase